MRAGYNIINMSVTLFSTTPTDTINCLFNYGWRVNEVISFSRL